MGVNIGRAGQGDVFDPGPEGAVGNRRIDLVNARRATFAANHIAAYTAAMTAIGDLPVADLVPLPPRRGHEPSVRLLRQAYANLAGMINELTAAGRAILARLKADWHARHDATVEPSPNMPLLRVDAVPGKRSRGAVGKAWRSFYFRSTFIEIKHDCRPPIAETFQDLRDTVITRMKEKGLSDHQIQSRSQHSLSQIRNILDNITA